MVFLQSSGGCRCIVWIWIAVGLAGSTLGVFWWKTIEHNTGLPSDEVRVGLLKVIEKTKKGCWQASRASQRFAVRLNDDDGLNSICLLYLYWVEHKAELSDLRGVVGYSELINLFDVLFFFSFSFSFSFIASQSPSSSYTYFIILYHFMAGDFV